MRAIKRTRVVQALRWPSIALVVLWASNQPHGVDCIFNCLNPGAIKMGKDSVGQPGLGGYPSVTSSLFPGATSGGYSGQTPAGAQMYPLAPGQMQPYISPLKRFWMQPKWRTGGLFGPKLWSGTGMKMQPRPYSYSGSYSTTGGVYGAQIIGYPFSELQVAPFTLPSHLESASMDYSWSPGYHQTPAKFQQNKYSSGGPYLDPATPTSTARPGQSLVDFYTSSGGSKGGGASATKTSTTTKNTLIADGGYNFFDADFLGGFWRNKNQTNSSGIFGYSYPDWYNRVLESPSKIAQQLFKQQNSKRQERLQQMPTDTKSASIVLAVSPSNNISPNSVLPDLVGPPRFIGFGTLDVLNAREARLSCSFNQAINQANKPIWVKFAGTYNGSFVAGTPAPPFNCQTSQCQVKAIDPVWESRYSFDNGPAASTLIIRDPNDSDYGYYRCSGLTKRSSSLLQTGPLQFETIYKIVRFFPLGKLN